MLLTLPYLSYPCQLPLWLPALPALPYPNPGPILARPYPSLFTFSYLCHCCLALYPPWHKLRSSCLYVTNLTLSQLSLSIATVVARLARPIPKPGPILARPHPSLFTFSYLCHCRSALYPPYHKLRSSCLHVINLTLSQLSSSIPAVVARLARPCPSLSVQITLLLFYFDG